MLENLHRIVNQVNIASNLREALSIVVSEVRQAIHADVCSVYLTDRTSGYNVLEASDGLHREAIGNVSIPLDKGLIGRVCREASPLNLQDAPAHPDYFLTAETGEQSFHGFLGVPIIQNRSVLGVLVVRRRSYDRFSDEEVTLLFTLAAQLAGTIVNARANGELLLSQEERESGGLLLSGRSSSGGVALGTVVVVFPEADLAGVPDRSTEHPELEEDSFRVAVQAVKEDLQTSERRMAGTLPKEDRALFNALILMLESESLIQNTIQRIHQGNWAAGALRETIEEHARIFDQMEDIYLRERASDVRDLGRRVLTYLNRDTSPIIDYPAQTILLGEEISVVQLAQVPPDCLAGVVTVTGSNTSHVAILARALGVPLVMGVAGLPVGRLERRPAVVDGYRGRVYLSPPASVWAEYSRLAAQELQLSQELDNLRDLPSQTRDQTAISLNLNTGLVAEMTALGKDIADGVGLYRTELPFMVRNRFPSEEEQRENYRSALEIFHPRQVTLRTLDIGGDKPLPYLHLQAEENPFLGWRGIRIALDRPDILSTQLRAMLRATIGLNNLRIMFPMVSGVREVKEAIAQLHAAQRSLREQGIEVALPPAGVMIEVPSAVYQCREIASLVDFLSIGTNDLTQYLLAVDRNNPNVSNLYDHLHPAVLRALLQVMDGAAHCNREVGVCGELAGNPLATPLLIGMGVRHLSMSSSSLLPVKWVVRTFTTAACKDLLQTALGCEDAAGVRHLMQQEFTRKGLSGLLRPGK